MQVLRVWRCWRWFGWLLLGCYSATPEAPGSTLITSGIDYHLTRCPIAKERCPLARVDAENKKGSLCRHITFCGACRMKGKVYKNSRHARWWSWRPINKMKLLTDVQTLQNMSECVVEKSCARVWRGGYCQHLWQYFVIIFYGCLIT